MCDNQLIYPIKFLDNYMSTKTYKDSICPIYFIDEIWKEIDDSIIQNINPGYYISTYGRLFSSNYGFYMKPAIDRYGYLTVNLQRKDGTRKYITIHRLVALAFIFNPDPINKRLVNHKDDIRTNPHVDNLEWCDYRYNILYTYRKSNIVNDYKSFTNEQVYTICNMLQSNISISDIVNHIYPDKINDPKFIKNAKQNVCRILRGDGYNDISIHYDFSNYVKESQSMDNDQIIKICEMIRDGYSNIDINRLLYSDYNDFDISIKNRLNSRISNIRHRKTYMDISKDYNW